MARILLLETSTASLTVALAEDGVVTARRICREPRMQASLTAPLVKEVLDEKNLGVRDCDAICVSKGPGSYTGLRVGVSTAKGLAFGAGIPLLSMGTLDILVAGARGFEGRIIPMIDARRMEVYTAVFSADGKQLSPVEAKVIDEQSFPVCRRRRPQMPGCHPFPQRPLPGSLARSRRHGRCRRSRLPGKKVRRPGVLRTLLSERFHRDGVAQEPILNPGISQIPQCPGCNRGDRRAACRRHPGSRNWAGHSRRNGFGRYGNSPVPRL